MSLDDHILNQIGNTLATAIRDSAVGLVRSGVLAESVPYPHGADEAAIGSGRSSSDITINPEIAADKTQVIESRRTQLLQEIPAELAGRTELSSLIASINAAMTLDALAKLAPVVAAKVQQVQEAAAIEQLNNQQNRKQQLKQLWSTIDTLNEDISKGLNSYLTDEEGKEEARLKRAKDQAKTEEEKEAAERALLRFYKDKGIDLAHSADADARLVGTATQKKIEEAEAALESVYTLQSQSAQAEHTKIVEAQVQISAKTKGAASVFDDPEPGNLVPNISPPSKTSDSGRAM